MFHARTSRLFCQILFAGVFVSAHGATAEPPPEKPAASAQIHFDRQIRPILSNSCFQCHGPDAAERQAELRLDEREAALAPAESGKRAIVPGAPDKSQLVLRVMSNDPEFMMPPPAANKRLTDDQKQLLKQWVAQGAGYDRHWSFVPPARPALPPTHDAAWPRNDIDRFILARLEAAGLKPAAAANKATLIRRLALDLTGLPPTPAEVDAFLADESPKAYEAVVDRLLASPHYGERMALDWLDAARYADTHGFHIDSGRDMTRWRQWVIDAFNRNLPFDQFTIEQLAGDLLPGATLEQQIASGFNRNHMINFEGGAIPEEYLTAYIVDRVNTTGTVWLGLTIGCAQCHDHKFDPLTQRDFYQFYAFFNNVPENGLDGSKGNAAPLVKTPSSAQQAELARLAAEIGRAEAQLAGPLPEIDAAQAAWEKSLKPDQPVEWIVLKPLDFKSLGGAALALLSDNSVLATGENPAVETYTINCQTGLQGITALRVEALPDEHFTASGPGRSVNGNVVLTDVRVTAGPASAPTAAKRVAFRRATADFSQQDFPVAAAIDESRQSGWAIYPQVGAAHHAVFETDQPLAAEGDLLITVTLDFQSQFAQHQLGRFRLAATVAANPVGERAPAAIAAILAAAPDQRTASQKAELQKFYRMQVSAPARRLADDLTALRKQQADLEKSVPTTMVMQELPHPRDAFMLVRGQYDKKGDKVQARVPASLPPLSPHDPTNRLGLARWLVSPEQPLTARVIVNRYWQMLFGTGLVKTSEDFGSQGEPPSHPELLDWLAVEFMSPGTAPGDRAPATWNVKALIKQIVMSATYRQASSAPAARFAADPENRLLGRGARLRLPAEFIRDQALAASGLLDRRIGGPSVSPYQPVGLWEELMSRADGKNWTAQTYVQSHGPDLYRRTMYTFWKRTSPPPTLTTFDAPDRETCTVRRARTNTPLQALVLLNDPTYVEASRKLAERVMTEAGPEAAPRIDLAFRLVLARRPTAVELGLLQTAFTDEWNAFRQRPEAAEQLLRVGESPRNARLDVAELAAWSTIAGIILNLDETVTRN